MSGFGLTLLWRVVHVFYCVLRRWFLVCGFLFVVGFSINGFIY